MTKLANEIVEIINSRNEYMEKQAGLSSFIAKKVIKPVSRFMFGKTDLAAAKARRYLQSSDLLDKAMKLNSEKLKINGKEFDDLGKWYQEITRNKSLEERMPDAMNFHKKINELEQVTKKLEQKGDILRYRLADLGKTYKNLGGSSGIREALDKANYARHNAYRFGRDLGILGSGGVVGGVAGRLTAPEPTLQDLLNKYKDRYFR